MAYLIICLRRINHMVVKDHLHSSSDVQEVVLSTLTLGQKWYESIGLPVRIYRQIIFKFIPGAIYSL
jgi:hypothetical protein